MRQSIALSTLALLALAAGMGLGARTLAGEGPRPVPAARTVADAPLLAPPATRVPRRAPQPPPPALAENLPELAPSPLEVAAPPLPVTAWSERFAALVQAEDWPQLAAELERLERDDPAAYRANHLGYLHARAALEAGAAEEAAARLAPYLDPESPFQSLAVYHAAELAAAGGRPEEAARLRRELLLATPRPHHWERALTEQLAWLDAAPAGAVLAAVAELSPRVSAGAERRALAALRVEALATDGQPAAARREGRELLAAGTADDAAERVARALDRAYLDGGLGELDAELLLLVADSLRHHRHWDRAVALYRAALPELPGARTAEVLFAIGRAQYFAERYAEARETYLAGAEVAWTAALRARLLYHAGRAAQLLGDDEEAERLLTRAIAVPGYHDATASALVTRLRARVARGELDLAHRDLRLLRRFFSRRPALVEGSVAYALGELAAGREAGAVQTLDRLPRSRLNASERAEVDYWRGRALAARDPAAALEALLATLRAPSSTHFHTFAHARLAEPSLAGAAAEHAGRLRAAAAERLAAGDAEAARRLQTDALLLAGDRAATDRAALADTYARLPAYRAVLELAPRPLPRFPLPADADRGELLVAMGLFDEAREWIGERYSTASRDDTLTRAVAYGLGGATRASIGAAELLAAGLPPGYQPALLPPLLAELLYPRSYLGTIALEAERHGADPRLLLAIMREESRFEPRAKSPAAARGLLQLMPSTADEMARALGLASPAPAELYGPPLAIRLGAKYVGDLQARLDGDLYATAAAYNAGPTQAQVWSRLAPRPGADFYLSTIGFAETKGYVRKVLDSYQRYGALYG